MLRHDRPLPYCWLRSSTAPVRTFSARSFCVFQSGRFIAELLLVLLLNPLRLTLCLCGDPAAYIPRTVNDSNPGGLRTHQELHRRAVGERDLLKVEGDAIDRFVRQKLLEPGDVLQIHVSTQSEHDRVRRR